MTCAIIKTQVKLILLRLRPQHSLLHARAIYLLEKHFAYVLSQSIVV